MRSGKELILATKAFAHEDIVKSWWALSSTLLLLASSLALTLSPIHWVGRLAASVIAGLTIVRLFVIYHDHLHNAILARSPSAKLLMRGVGLFLLAPSTIWKHSHNQHHAHNSKLRDESPGSFPVMTDERFRNSTRLQRWAYLLNRSPLTLLLGYVTVFLHTMCLAPLFHDARHHWDGALALALHIGLYVLLGLTLGWAAILFALVLPFGIACALGSYLFYAQHNFPDVELMTTDDGWTYEGAALRSSSYCRMGPLMRYFTANIGYHHIHHLNCRIPFYRLPEAFREMPELATPKTTTLSPVDMLRCLQLDVWETRKNRLVPAREIERDLEKAG